MKKVLCKICNKEYLVKPYRVGVSKYCSHKCYAKSLVGIPSWNKGKKLTQEHKRKLSEAKLKNPVRYWKGKHTPLQGSNHHNWRGGINSVNDTIRKSLEYKLWRIAVFTRDNYQCVRGGKKHGSKLHADHIKPFSLYPDLRFAIDNGRTLCVECHKKTSTWGYNAKFYKGGING